MYTLLTVMVYVNQLNKTDFVFKGTQQTKFLPETKLD